jgi:hypothetical protein
MSCYWSCYFFIKFIFFLHCYCYVEDEEDDVVAVSDGAVVGAFSLLLLGVKVVGDDGVELVAVAILSAIIF